MQAKGWKGWVVFGIGAILAVRSGMEVVRLYKTGDKVDEVKQELARVQKEHSDLESRLSEVQSQEFVEKEARDRLGLGRPGEAMLILPEQENKGNEHSSAEASAGKPNWKKWWEMYVAR